MKNESTVPRLDEKQIGDKIFNLIKVADMKNYLKLLKDENLYPSSIKNLKHETQNILFAAAQIQDHKKALEFSKIHIGYGVDIKCKDINGQTPLYYASREGNT